MASTEIVRVTTRATSLARSQEVLDAFLEGRTPNTLLAYMRDLGDFARWLTRSKQADPAAAVEALLAAGHGEANRITLKYVAHLKARKLAPATICRRLAALRSMVRVGRQIGRVVWSLDIDGPRVETYRDTRGPGREGYLRMKEVVSRAAYEAGENDAVGARAKRDLAMMLLMHDLCLRRGSVAALELADVSLDDDPPMIEVLAKGKTQKEIKTLPRQHVDALRGWIAARGMKPGPLFVRLDAAAGDEPAPLDGESINRAVRRAGLKAGLSRPARAHGLRHQGATRSLDLNHGNIRETQALTGHAKPETVMKYDDRRRDGSGKLAQMLADDSD